MPPTNPLCVNFPKNGGFWCSFFSWYDWRPLSRYEVGIGSSSESHLLESEKKSMIVVKIFSKIKCSGSRWLSQLHSKHFPSIRSTITYHLHVFFFIHHVYIHFIDGMDVRLLRSNSCINSLSLVHNFIFHTKSLPNTFKHRSFASWQWTRWAYLSKIM